MDREKGIDVDPLAVALTRPSTILGVPYEACMINILVSVEALSLTENLMWLLMCVPVHGVCYLITLNDPRSFELLLLWARTKLGTLIATRWYWNASSYGPLYFRERFGSFKRWRIKRHLKLETQV
jgi:type IV secretion system protein VirB3